MPAGETANDRTFERHPSVASDDPELHLLAGKGMSLRAIAKA